MNERLTPLPYQEHDIEEIVKHDGNALIVSSVGGRKTLTAVEVALRLKVKAIMVIAPQNTLESWVETILGQDPDARIVRMDSSKPGRAAVDDLQWGEAGWYVCTPQWFARQDWMHIHPDQIIFDEIHTAGNYDNITRVKMHQLDGPRKMGLSGTLLRNKFENAWALVRWIWPWLMPKTFWVWRKQDCEGKRDPFAPMNWKVTGEKIPGQLVNSLPCYIQHLPREACCEFHPNGFMADLEEPVEIIRTLQLSSAQKRFYAQMEKDYVAWLTTPNEDGKLPVVAQLPIVARGMLRTCTLGLPSIDPTTGKLYFEDDCESPKLDDPEAGLIKTLSQIDNERAIVYTHDKRFAKVAVKRLIAAGYRAVEWSGDVKKIEDRKKIKAAFIAGEIHVVVAVIAAIGTGTDGIQKAASVEIWLSESDDATDNEQGRGRLDRPGQKRQVLRIKLHAQGTMDEGIVSKQVAQALRLNKSLRKQMKKR